MRNKIRVPRPHSCAVLETPGSNATRAANDTSSTWSVARSGPLASITARMSLIAAQMYQAQLCHVTAHVGDCWKEVDTLCLIVRERGCGDAFCHLQSGVPNVHALSLSLASAVFLGSGGRTSTERRKLVKLKMESFRPPSLLPRLRSSARRLLEWGKNKPTRPDIFAVCRARGSVMTRSNPEGEGSLAAPLVSSSPHTYARRRVGLYGEIFCD